MEESRMEETFKVLHKNMPRAPEALVEKTVRIAKALEAKRVKATPVADNVRKKNLTKGNQKSGPDKNMGPHGL